MKKLLLCVLIVCVFFCVLTLSACNNTEGEQSSDYPCYEMTLTYDGNKTVDFSEELFFTAPDDIDDVKLHLYPNAFSESASTPPISQSEWNNVQSFGAIEILSVKINRINCAFEICGDDDTILFIPFSASRNESVTLSVSGVITLPSCIARFGENDLTVNLTGFYPVLCARIDGVWLTDGYSEIGDPFCLDTADYYVTVNYPSTLVLASPGKEKTTEANGIKTSVIEAERIRDFALVFSSDFKTATATTNSGVKVIYHYFDDDDFALDVAVKAIETFSSAFGNYPYDTYTLVRSPINSGGMEYGSLAIISPIASLETVVHETAHQWWYNVVGNDQVRESWLDEGLTEFSTAYFFTLNDMEENYASFMKGVYDSYSEWKQTSPSLKMTTDLYTCSATDYVSLSYVKGAILFDTLRTLLGDEHLLSALSTYYRDNAYTIATAQDLVSAFNSVAPAAGGIILSFLSGNELIY